MVKEKKMSENDRERRRENSSQAALLLMDCSLAISELLWAVSLLIYLFFQRKSKMLDSNSAMVKGAKRLFDYLRDTFLNMTDPI